MQYYAQIVNNIVVNVIEGDPTGRFHESIVWTPCTATTRIGDIYNVIDDTFVTPTLSLQEEKQISLNLVNQIYSKLVDRVTLSFPPEERLTWPFQIMGAIAITKDPTTDDLSAMFLREHSKVSQIPIDVLVGRVNMLAGHLLKVLGKYTGKRQLLEAQVNGCETMVHLNIVRKKIDAWMTEEGV